MPKGYETAGRKYRPHPKAITRPTSHIRLAALRRRAAVSAAVLHCIMCGVLRHMQRNALAGHPSERCEVSAAALGALAALLILGAVPLAARADWTFGADASLRHDNNVGNAESSSAIVADSTIDARLTAFRVFPLGDSYSVTIGGDLGGETYRKLAGLDEASADGSLSLKRKWGLGAFAPWARAGISVARSSYDDSDRNAWDYRATLAAGRRFDERWNFWAEYAFERRAASPQMQVVPQLSGDAFSQDSHNLTANLEYSLRENTSLALTLLGRQGDVVSTSSGYSKYYAGAQAAALDPAFGPRAYAYKITGTTFGFRLGIDYSPTAHSAFGFGFERLDTQAYGGNDYSKSIAEITADYRF